MVPFFPKAYIAIGSRPLVLIFCRQLQKYLRSQVFIHGYSHWSTFCFSIKTEISPTSFNSGSEYSFTLLVSRSVTAAISVFCPFKTKPYSMSTLLGRLSPETLWMILPLRSKAYNPPSVSLSVPMMMLFDASLGLIHMAGSSVSWTTASVITAGFNFSTDWCCPCSSLPKEK